jgi:hypothetical protein
MKNKILKHLTITGFVKGEDLTTIEMLEKNLAAVKVKMRSAKKEVAKARRELNSAVEDSLKKIEKEKKGMMNMRVAEPGETTFSSVFRFDDIKSKYEKTLAEIEVKKNEIAKKIAGYTSEGTEKWENFKPKLNHDLEELGKALKGFTQPAK